MIQNMFSNHEIGQMRKRDITYGVMGFVFAAAEMNITFISYHFPIYRRILVYAIMPILLTLLLILLVFGKSNAKKASTVHVLLLFAICICGVSAAAFSHIGVIQSLGWMVSLLLIPTFFMTMGREMPLSVVKGISAYCWIVVSLQLLSVILFHTTGLYTPENSEGGRLYFFLGHVNSSVKVVLPALAIITVVDIWSKGKVCVHTWIVTLTSLASLFYTESYTGAVGLSFYVIILFIFTKCGWIVDWLPKWSPLALSGLLFLIIVIVRSAFQSVVQFGAALGREGSIITRGTIWDMGFSAIEKNINGYGPFCDYSQFIRIGSYYPSSAHNLFIDSIIQVGVIGAILFVLLLFLLINYMPSWRKWPMIPATLFSYAIMWNFEPFFVDLYLQCTILILYLMFSLPDEKMHKKRGEK